MDGSTVFARWHQCALLCDSFSPPESTTQMANRSVQPFLHNSQQKVLILYNGQPFPPKIAPSHMGSGPHLIHDSLGQSKPTIQTAFRLVRLFSHRWLQSVPILDNGMPHFPLKIAYSYEGSGPQLIHGSLGPPESLTQMASRSVQLFLQGSLVWQTDQLTDHATRLVTTDHI